MISFSIPKFHDRTRRKICILAFFAVCIAPTCCMLAWGISRNVPGHVSGYVERLEGSLGLAVAIDDVEHPRPGVVRYRQVRLRDPETGEVVSTFHRVEVRRQDVKESPRPALVLVVDSARISPERFDSLPRLLYRVMARRMTRDNIDLRLVIGEIEMQEGEDSAGEGAATIRAMRGSLQTGRDGAQSEFKFRLESSADRAEATDAVCIRIRRDRRTTPPSLCFEIDSRTAPIPCNMLSLFRPECKSLGPGSRFQGYLFAEQTVDGWQGCIQNATLTDIDLARLFGKCLPNTMTGRAQVTIHQANFSGGRLQQAAGSIAAGPGTIGHDFYDSLWSKLRLRYRTQPPEDNRDIPYEKLALDFTIDQDGLQIKGTVPDQADPIILTNSTESLLGEWESKPQPLSALLGILAPKTSPHMPVTRQTQWMASLLPVPEGDQPQRR